MKKISLILLFGFLFGATVAGFVSPSVISWYFDPPAAMGVSCKAAVLWGLGAYQKILLAGGGFGLLVTGVLLVTLKARKRDTESSSAEKTL